MKTKTKKPSPPLTAKQFIDRLTAQKSSAELKKNKRFYVEEGKDKCLGVRMKIIFDTSKAAVAMPLPEIEKLFASPYYEVRMGAVGIMDWQARDKKTTEEEKEALFNLYIRQHHRINNWDLVDRSAPYVVGGYLHGKSKAIIYQLAKSRNPWERRTAITSTYFFIRQNEVNETFKIAELLVHDSHDLIQKAVGSWIREAGKRDRQKLITFLDKYAATMPRPMLRNAIERLDKKQKALYMKMKTG